MAGSSTVSAKKKPTNVSINPQLLADARQFEINLSSTLEKALEQEVKLHKRQQWLAENKESLEYCNEMIEEHGLFSDDYRVF